MIAFFLTPSYASPDPAWADARATELASAAPVDRLDLVRTWVEGEPEPDRRASLVALGRLGGILTEDPAPNLASYAGAMLVASSAGERSYIAAAAGFGGAVDADGAPTMTIEQARSVYAARRASVGGVRWELCWDNQGDLQDMGATQVDARWVPQPVEADTKLRRALHEAWDRDCAEIVGWSVYIGERPVGRARDLPAGILSEACVVGPIALRGISGLAMTDPRPEDCLALDEAQVALGPYNAGLRDDLRLAPTDVADLKRPASPKLRQCESPKPAFSTVCQAMAVR